MNRLLVTETETPREAIEIAPKTSFPRVVICTPTCQRPQNLTELLRSIQRLDRKGIDLHLAVVDNDPARSAETIVADVMRSSDIPVTYDCIPERNLPVVRNRLVSLAAGQNPDWVWFLDDDQFVEPDALQHMLATAQVADADCVVGRVPHTFEGSTSSWAKWSGLFDEVHRPTGQPTKRFGTNGPLVRFAALSRVKGPFDPELKFSGGHHGGEDSDFFTRFHSLGHTSVGCDEAVIYDRVHTSRNNPKWLTGRSLRTGQIKGYLVREVDASPIKTVSWFAKGAGYTGLNLLSTLVTLPFGPRRYFPFWIRSAQGYGLLHGLLLGRKSVVGRDPGRMHGQ